MLFCVLGSSTIFTLFFSYKLSFLTLFHPSPLSFNASTQFLHPDRDNIFSKLISAKNSEAGLSDKQSELSKHGWFECLDHRRRRVCEHQKAAVDICFSLTVINSDTSTIKCVLTRGVTNKMILPSRVPCKAVAAANAHCLKLSFQIFCICGLGLTLSVLATVDHANFTVRWVPVEMITD